MNDREKLIAEQALSLPPAEREEVFQAQLTGWRDASAENEKAFREEIQRRLSLANQ